MEIRLATTADEAAVCRLWTGLLNFYKKHASPEVLQRSFRYAVKNPLKVQVYVIAIEGTVAGTASLHLGHYSTWNDNWYGHIEDLIIDQSWRGRGYACRLLRHIIAAAEEQNLSRVELNALNENQAARRLYEKLGFTSDSVVYELPLNRPDSNT
jgi:ribosomal protein S18 acetylase RimI-like enzyme